MREVEVKMRAPDDLESRLDTADATFLGEGSQTDTYYRHPGRDFEATDEALRIRETDDRVLTYKGPRGGGPVKDRVEWETAVGPELPEILAALGFTPAARITKHRKSWQVLDATVTLDELDGLGRFVEVEANPGLGADVVEAAMERLGLAGDRISASYLELALDADAACVQRL